MKKEILRISIHPQVFKAMRESSGFGPEEIAKKIKVDAKKIAEIEEGKASLTLTQVKNLSKVLQRPLVAFFTTVPPTMPISLTDYRINREKKLSSGVYLAQRRAFYLSGKIHEISGKKSRIPIFPESFTPEKMANEFRTLMGLEINKSKKPDIILNTYKDLVEEKLSILVTEFPMKTDDVRAFSISTDLSTLVLNEKDSPQVKLFSLFHEICHLLKHKSGICSIDIEQKGQDKEESFCDKFAAEILVPTAALKKEMGQITTISDERVASLAQTYGVSKQVIWLRLLWLDYIDLNRYAQYKNEIMPKTTKTRPFGKRNWEKVYYNRVGRLAMKEIASSYKKGDISYADVIDVINTNSKYADKFIA
jgi:Zn-dependent peptidase ImmA (M78 family)/transcriptional regulator with XRE-family HTH domain